MAWGALWLSLRLAIGTTGVLLVIGLPLAWWLAATRSRWRVPVEALVSMPIVLPPTVMGFYLLLLLGPRTLLGRAFEGALGHAIPFSFTGILIGSVLFNLPFAVRPMAAAFAGVDRRLVEASWCLGASRLRSFLTIVMPLGRAGILTAAALTFAHTIGEFGVVLMVGGNIPGATQTMSTVIYDQVQAMDYAGANRTALLLVGVSFAALCTTYAVSRRPAL
jgi:molybdate transport system permease protein